MILLQLSCNAVKAMSGYCNIHIYIYIYIRCTSFSVCIEVRKASAKWMVSSPKVMAVIFSHFLSIITTRLSANFDADASSVIFFFAVACLAYIWRGGIVQCIDHGYQLRPPSHDVKAVLCYMRKSISLYRTKLLYICYGG